MTPTQTKIVAACVAVAAAAFGALGISNQQTFAKHDMLGVVPGMSREQVRKHVTSRKWSCEAQTNALAIACKTDAGVLTLGFANNTDEAKVREATVVLANRDKLSFADMTKSVSSQYSRSPTTTADKEAVWKLDPTLTLTLQEAEQMKLTISRTP